MADRKKYTKMGLVQARLDNAELREVVTKANMYTKGNVSAFVREAVLGWRPLKRAEKK